MNIHPSFAALSTARTTPDTGPVADLCKALCQFHDEDPLVWVESWGVERWRLRLAIVMTERALLEVLDEYA